MQNIKEYYNQEKLRIKQYIESQKEKPTLCIIQVGNNEASNRYVRNKIKDCESVGIKTILIKLKEDVSQEEVEFWVRKYAYNEETPTIVQLPLPNYLDLNKIYRWLVHESDVDGTSYYNKCVNPCTPQGIISYLESEHFNFKDKNALVIGRSDIVGKPMAKLLLEHNCNVMQVHSKTSNINLLKMLDIADLVIVATGHKDTITSSMIKAVMKENQVIANKIIFDVGINFDENGKLIGDCERDLPVLWQSPVPNGVGLLTRLKLLKNICKLEYGEEI